MDIILLEKISNLGNLGDQVKVKSGYARNFLIPHGKAVRATTEKIAEFEGRRAELESKEAKDTSEAESRKQAISELALTIMQKAGEGGRLFGSVGTQNIVDAITEAGVEVKKHEVRLPNGVLRNTGDFEIDIQLHSDVIAVLALKIVAEE